MNDEKGVNLNANTGENILANISKTGTTSQEAISVSPSACTARHHRCGALVAAGWGVDWTALSSA